MVSGSLPTALGSAENSLAVPSFQAHTHNHTLFFDVFFLSPLAHACKGGIAATFFRVFHAFFFFLSIKSTDHRTLKPASPWLLVTTFVEPWLRRRLGLWKLTVCSFLIPGFGGWTRRMLGAAFSVWQSLIR